MTEEAVHVPHPELLRGGKVIGLMAGHGELRPKMGIHFLSAPDPNGRIAHLIDATSDFFRQFNPEEGKSFDFREVIQNGTQEILSRYEVAQPLLVLLSILSRHEWEKTGGKLHLLAGHSAGEFSVLAGNCISAEEALKAAAAHGRIVIDEIKRSVKLGEPQTAMYALLKSSPIHLEELFNSLRGHGINPPDSSDPHPDLTGGYALINGPEDVVVWTQTEKYPELERTLAEQGIVGYRFAMPAAIHADTPAMRRVKTRMIRVFESFNWRDPAIPIIMNASTRIAHTKEEVLRALLDTHTHMVDWMGCMGTMREEGVDGAIQFGPGVFLAKQMKKLFPHITTVNHPLPRPRFGKVK